MVQYIALHTSNKTTTENREACRKRSFPGLVPSLINMVTPIVPPLSGYTQTPMEEDPLLYSEAPWLRARVRHSFPPLVAVLWGGPSPTRGVTERALGSYEWRKRVAIPRGGLSVPIPH